MWWKSKKKKEEEARVKAEAEAAANAAFEKAAAPKPPLQPKTPYDMLLVALRNKNLARAEEAIALGADVTANGNEPLHVVAGLPWEQGDAVFKMARALVLAGADINGALKTARQKQEAAVGPGDEDNYSGYILDNDVYNRYDGIGRWLRENQAGLLEEYINAKLKPLEQERDELKRQLQDIQIALGKAPKPPAQKMG